MKILFVGPGPLSTYLAVRFAVHTRHEVCLLENNEHTVVSDNNEITITDVENKKVYGSNRLTIYKDITKLTQVEIIILASRTSLNKNLLPYLSKLYSSKTSVILLQNGLDFENEIAQTLFPGNWLYSGACWIKVTAITPYNLRHDFGNSIKLGCYSHKVEITSMDVNIQSLFEEAGLQVELITNIKSVQLTKLALNVPLFVLAATEEKSYPEILHCPHLDKQRHRLQEEIAFAAAKIDCPVDLDFIENMISKLRKIPMVAPDSRTQFAESMKQELPLNADPLLNLMFKHNIELKLLMKYRMSL